MSDISILVQVWPPYARYADKSVFVRKLFYLFNQWQDSGGQTVRPGVAAGAVGMDGGIQVNGWAFAAFTLDP